MPWFLASPGLQHTRYWFCRIVKFLSYMRKDFNYLCHDSVEEWFYVSSAAKWCRGDWEWPHSQDTHRRRKLLNSLVPERCGGNFKSVISEHMLQSKFMSLSCKITLSWMPWNTCDDQSTLVQVMAWCHQASNHYLSQYWSRSMSPYGVTKQQCYWLLCT